MRILLAVTFGGISFLPPLVGFVLLFCILYLCCLVRMTSNIAESERGNEVAREARLAGFSRKGAKAFEKYKINKSNRKYKF